MKHWLCWQESNIEAARYILAHRDDPALACLIEWAERVLARHRSNPAEPSEPPPAQAELFGEKAKRS
jgi:hypothetical protein